MGGSVSAFYAGLPQAMEAAMAAQWRVRWEFRERSGYGAPMSHEQAMRAAERSNAIDPAIWHWAEPIPAQELTILQRWGLTSDTPPRAR
jgi:hypothetical protein